MPAPAVTAQSNPVPPCVDLDGTLIKTDLLWESLVRLLKQNPLYGFAALAWWLKGRACLKARIADHVGVDAAWLPYNQRLLDFLSAEKRSGRPIFLVTA